MTPLRLSNIWYRRLYVALFVMSLGYVALFSLHTFDLQSVPESVRPDGIAALGGLIVAIASVILFIMVKKVSSFIPTFATYAIFALTTAYLVQATGGVDSGFLAVWALVVFTSPLFGAYGWLPVVVMTGSYVAAEYLSGALSTDTFVTVILSCLLPLVAGLTVWRETPETEETASRKSLANQLSEVATKSEIVINAIGDGVIAVDGTGVIQLINPAAQQVLGWGKQDALMLSYKSILKLNDANGNEIDPTQDPIQQVLNTNQESRSNKLIAITNSGKKISLSLVATPIGDPGAGAIAVFRDVTNERAEERQQAEFISTASHEMRTPVASIEGYLGLALNPQTATIDQKARDFITKAHEAAEHLGRLFQDLLDVSKSEDGRLTNVPRVVDLVPFIQTITEGLTQKAQEKGLALSFVPGEGNGTERGIKKVMPVYYVNLDNDHIREVLNNLIENAIKYTPSGSVSVDINGTDEKVVISIKDTGLGIPTEDIPHLFQKFYRVENMDRQAIGGTGLGLYLCRRLVEAMQGRLWVESEFGSGSTFFVELPRLDSQDAERLRVGQQHQDIPFEPIQPSVQIPASAGAPALGRSIPVTFADIPVTPAAPPTPTPQPVAPTPVATTPQPQPQPQPQPLPAPAQYPAQPAPQQAAPALTTNGVQPATTVPRGETLTREQINERVRQLEALAMQQRGSVSPPARQ